MTFYQDDTAGQHIENVKRLLDRVSEMQEALHRVHLRAGYIIGQCKDQAEMKEEATAIQMIVREAMRPCSA